MKKILIALLLVLLIALNCLAIFKGINLFGFKIISFGQIKENSTQLDQKIAQATALGSTEYPNILKTMDANVKKLEQEKKNYEDMVTISTNEQVQFANQYQKYEVEYLWTIIGNHATKEGVVIKIDIVSAAGNNRYNLNFTVNGSYIGTTEFISDIENDSALGFKIENFCMKPGGSTQELQTTFSCKDIEIKDIQLNNNTKFDNTDDSDDGSVSIDKKNTSKSTKKDSSTESTAVMDASGSVTSGSSRSAELIELKR